jgi:hypothetical protein
MRNVDNAMLTAHKSFVETSSGLFAKIALNALRLVFDDGNQPSAANTRTAADWFCSFENDNRLGTFTGVVDALLAAACSSRA